MYAFPETLKFEFKLMQELVQQTQNYSLQSSKYNFTSSLETIHVFKRDFQICFSIWLVLYFREEITLSGII